MSLNDLSDSAVLVLASSMVVLLVSFVLLVSLRRPVYRLTSENLIRLFELVLAGQASPEDWDVFVSIPIRHNDELESIRARSEGLEDGFSIVQGFIVVPEESRKLLEIFLGELRAQVID